MTTETEQKVFTTEDDRTAAINALANEPPMEVRMDMAKWAEWDIKYLADLEALETAKIDPEYKPEGGDQTPSQDPAPQGQPQPQGQQPAQEQQPAGPTPEQLRMQDLERQRDQSAQTAKTDMEQQKTDFDKQIADLKAEVEANKKPEADPEPEIDRNIQLLEGQIAEIDKDLEGKDPLADENYAKNLNKKMKISDQLRAAERKADARKFKKYEADMASAKKDNDDRIAKMKADAEANEDVQKAEKYRKAVIKEATEFQGKHEELQAKDSYEKMHKDWMSFMNDVAGNYYNKPVVDVSPEEREIISLRYTQNPQLMAHGLEAKGVKEPAFLRQFLTIYQVQALKEGYQLNPTTGKYLPYTDATGKQVNLVDWDMAYDHLQAKSGKKGADLLAAQVQGANELARSIDTRANPVELEGHQQRQQPESPMKYEEAMEKLDMKKTDGSPMFDEVAMVTLARNSAGGDIPVQVKEYNKLLMAIGQDPIDQNS